MPRSDFTNQIPDPAQGPDRVFKAEYESQCDWCQESIWPGNSIIRHDVYGFVHWRRCYNAAERKEENKRRAKIAKAKEAAQ